MKIEETHFRAASGPGRDAGNPQAITDRTAFPASPCGTLCDGVPLPATWWLANIPGRFATKHSARKTAPGAGALPDSIGRVRLRLFRAAQANFWQVNPNHISP